MDKIVENFKKQMSVVLPDYILSELQKDPICEQLYLTDIGYYPDAKYHHRVREKGSSQYILIYCIKGKGWISETGRKITVKTNQYFIIPPHVAHAYASDEKDPWSIFWVHFTGHLATHFYDTIGSAKSIIPSNLDRIDDRIQLFNEIITNLELGYGAENLRYANICLMHFLSSFKYVSQFREIRKSEESDGVTSSIAFMKRNLEKKHSLAGLSSESGLSPSQYSLLFRKKTGRSPMDYLTNLRVQKACQFLDNSTLRVGEVALKVGYSDPFHFSRIFKHVMGVSPVFYRKQPKG